MLLFWYKCTSVKSKRITRFLNLKSLKKTMLFIVCSFSNLMNIWFVTPCYKQNIHHMKAVWLGHLIYHSLSITAFGVWYSGVWDTRCGMVIVAKLDRVFSFGSTVHVTHEPFSLKLEPTDCVYCVGHYGCTHLHTQDNILSKKLVPCCLVDCSRKQTQGWIETSHDCHKLT